MWISSSPRFLMVIFPWICVVGAHDKTRQPANACQTRTAVSQLRLPEFFLDSQRDFGQVPSVPQCPQHGQAFGGSGKPVQPNPTSWFGSRQSFVILLDPHDGVGSALAGHRRATV